MKATSWRKGLLVGSAALALLVTSGVRADGEIPGLLFQGGIVVPPVPVVVDPRLPRGPALAWSLRPQNHVRDCSATYPLCVHGGTASSRHTALSSLEHAYVRWTYVAQRPQPLGDLALGGGPQLDVYLKAQPEPLVVERDAPRLAADKSSGFCTLNPTAIHQTWLTLCVAEVASLGVDAALGDGLRRGWARHQIAPLVRANDTTSFAAIDKAQANPQAPPVTGEYSTLSDASSLFFNHLDANLGAAAHGDLPLAMLTLARPQGADAEAHPQWNDAPDMFDVLRRAFNDDGPRIATHLVNFAVWRAFVGSRADALHRPALAALGELGRVRFDWVLRYSSLPRHVAGPYPVYPLGAAYIWVELDGVVSDAPLAFRAEWEQPVQFQWALVRVDAQGRALSQVTLPYLERGSSVEKTLMNVGGAAGLLIVGANLGGIDPSHPFDPDQEPWEPHGYSIYLTLLESE